MLRSAKRTREISEERGTFFDFAIQELGNSDARLRGASLRPSLIIIANFCFWLLINPRMEGQANPRRRPKHSITFRLHKLHHLINQHVIDKLYRPRDRA